MTRSLYLQSIVIGSVLRRTGFVCLALAAAAPGVVGAMRLRDDSAASQHTESIDGRGGLSIARLPDRLIVDATGDEFRWRFRYLGEDLARGADDMISEGLLVVPAGTEVELRVTSSDYIYHFAVPEREFSEVAVPGMTFANRFFAPEPAAYELPVDPLCNFDLYHDQPMGRIVVVNRSRFAAWFAERKEAP